MNGLKKHVSVILLFSLLFAAVLMLQIRSEFYDYRWWDNNWAFRVGLEINASSSVRTNWPVDYDINFTYLLQNLSMSGTFNINSTRVIEYTSSGNIIHEVPSQFDAGDGFNASTNAAGTVTFFLNGTTQANSKRYYFIYFDIAENGAKNQTGYGSDLANSSTSDEFNVNNSILEWHVDTQRGENTSGLYRVRGRKPPAYNDIFGIIGDSERTIEYTKYSNGTNNLSFDFRNNFTFKSTGPLRIVVEQRGNETLWNNPDQKTGEGFMVKRYIFYSNMSWIKIEQVFTNMGNQNITRGSSACSALAFDALRALGSDYLNDSNSTDPGSWVWAAESGASWDFGIINLNESVPNFYASNCYGSDMAGITLQDINITPGGSIQQMSVVRFNDTQGDVNFVKSLKEMLVNNVVITRLVPEKILVFFDGKSYYNQTIAQVFNRNETVLIKVNVSYDPYNLSDRINASLDMGTASAGDDLMIMLYDDGTHGDSMSGDNLYATTHNLSTWSATGLWNLTLYVYDNEWRQFNRTWFTFNVSDTLNVNATVINKIGLVLREVNATVRVRGVRNDTWVAGASLNCTYASSQVNQSNITDYNNGTYLVKFTSPSSPGAYTLNCTATKYNNTGWGADEFTSENLFTYLDVKSYPNNYTAQKVAWFVNESFPIIVNITNIENGSALNTNVTLLFSNANITANTSLVSCGDILVSKYCEKHFLITARNGTVPGNYTVNITVDWDNSNAPRNSTSTLLNITVLPNVSMQLSTNNISGMIGLGLPLKNIANFTVYAMGNSQLSNVTFNVSGFDPGFLFVFSPENASYISPGGTRDVMLFTNVSPSHSAGGFNGTINVTSGNDGYGLINLSVYITGTNMSIDLSLNNYTAQNITWRVNESFPVYAFIQNTGNATGYGTNITLSFSSGNITANSTMKQCGDMEKNTSCYEWFLITARAGAPPGNYTANVSARWFDPDTGSKSNSSIINITVISNKIYNVSEGNITVNVTHGVVNYIGNFTLNNTGNDYIYNITYNITNITGDLPITFWQENVTILSPGEVRGIGINVTVPLGYLPSVHYGTLNITSANSFSYERNVKITVSTTRTWTMSSTYCEKIMTPEVGSACNITVNNTGNVPTNFTITPITSSTNMTNRTWTNETGFYLENLTAHTFQVLYNISGVPVVFYRTNYTIKGVQAESDPKNSTLQIVLNPFVKPGINITAIPSMAQQGGTVTIHANITDHSGVGIQTVTVNVTTPGNVTTTKSMNYCGEYYSGFHCYEIDYPYDIYSGTWGNTSLTGNYTIRVYAQDNQGKNDTVNTTFTVYNRLGIDIQTDPFFYQGETCSVMFYTRDMLGLPIGSAPVGVNLFDPSGRNVTHYFWTGKSTVTDSGGNGGLLFIMPSGAPLGSYTLSVNSSAYLPSFNQTVYNTTNHTFVVRNHRTVYGSVGIPDPSYKDKVMPVNVIVLDQNGETVDPDSMSLIIYYTEGYSLQVWRNLTMSNFTRASEGFYSYTEVLSNVLTGSYLALLKVTYDNRENWDLNAFRIVSGGPYDVEITSLEHEVTRSDYLDFELYIENMGEVSHDDVLVEYWTAGNNATWDYSNASIKVPAYSNRTLLRNLYIPSMQPIGTYTLNVKVTYDPSLSPATANATFFVVSGEKPPEIPGGPGGGEGAPSGAPAGGMPMPSGAPGLEITKYPEELGAEVGTTKYSTIEVKNTGNTTLHNVSIAIRGIPSAWIEITPNMIDTLVMGNTSSFSVKISIPFTTEAKEFPATIVGYGNNRSLDQKSFKMVVFLSREMMVEWEINRLKTALSQLETDVTTAKNSGKDVSEVEPLLKDIQKSIDDAENYMKDKRYDDALQAVFVGWGLVERAKYLLSKAPFGPGMLITGLPLWLIALLALLAVALIVSVFMMKRMKGAAENMMRMQIPGARPKTVLAEKIEEKEGLETEKAKIMRVLGLLEKEYKEGLITEKAYNDLASRNRERLKTIEDTLTKVR
jgi:uncharacterized membrane protein